MESTVQDRPEAPELTNCLESWPLEKRVEAGKAVHDLVERREWAEFSDVVGARIVELNRSMTKRLKPFESPAQYEAILGEIRGLESISALVNGAIKVGDETAELLRRDTES